MNCYVNRTPPNDERTGRLLAYSPKHGKDNEYPGLVVLMRPHRLRHGTVIRHSHKDIKNTFPIGYTSNGWSLMNFDLFTGAVEIRNED